MAAVCHDGYALLHVREQTQEICMAAVQKDPSAIVYIRDQEMREQVEKALQEQVSTMSVF